MTKIEKFYQTATDSEWEAMAALRKEAGKDPARISFCMALRLKAYAPMS